MTLLDDHYRKVPEYYDWMYLDGFTPDEILYALHKKMDREQAEREALAESVVTVKIRHEQNERLPRRENVGYVIKGTAIRHRPENRLCRK